VTDAELGTLQRRAQLALAGPLLESGIALDRDRRCERLEDNLATPLSASALRQVRADFGSGAGGELHATVDRRPKLHSAHSSSALAVSTFGSFLDMIGALEVAGTASFEALRFEAKLPTGVRGTPPHLDVVATGAAGRLAVESKCTEYLAPKLASFSDAYERLAATMDPSWRALYELLLRQPGHFRLLDAAQLVKHYWGLSNTRAGGTDVLLYIYWEPLDADAHETFAEHRDEVEEFSGRVGDPDCRFVALSYRELWQRWTRAGGWHAEHVAAQRRRYGVSVGSDASDAR
jgi:hypothetical protein